MSNAKFLAACTAALFATVALAAKADPAPRVVEEYTGSIGCSSPSALDDAPVKAESKVISHKRVSTNASRAPAQAGDRHRSALGRALRGGGGVALADQRRDGQAKDGKPHDE